MSIQDVLQAARVQIQAYLLLILWGQAAWVLVDSGHFQIIRRKTWAKVMPSNMADNLLCGGRGFTFFTLILERNVCIYERICDSFPHLMMFLLNDDGPKHAINVHVWIIHHLFTLKLNLNYLFVLFVLLVQSLNLFIYYFVVRHQLDMDKMSKVCLQLKIQVFKLKI